MLPLRAGEGDGAPHGIAEVELPLEIVAPGGGVRVLEIRHEDPRARVQRVDDHFAVHGAGNLDAAVQQVSGNRRDGPVRLAHRTRLWQEFGALAGVETSLARHAAREQLLAAQLTRPRQHRKEAPRLGRQDLCKPRLQGRVQFEPGA